MTEEPTTTIRAATAADVPAMVAMINHFAELNLMLPRREAAVSSTLEDWRVAVAGGGDGPVVGCGAVVALSDTLAEVRSLAVHQSQHGRGVGGALVRALTELARERGFEQLCALTLRAHFFERLGFHVVDRWSISPKLWQECIYCPKFHRCDEVAVLLQLTGSSRPREVGEALRSGAWNSLLKWSEWQPLKLAYRREPIPLEGQTEGGEKE